MWVMASSAAALLSTSSAMSIGSVARETRSTSRRTPSSRTMTSSGARFSSGSPLSSTALTKSVRSRPPAWACVRVSGTAVDGKCDSKDQRAAPAGVTS